MVLKPTQALSNLQSGTALAVSAVPLPTALLSQLYNFVDIILKLTLMASEIRNRLPQIDKNTNNTLL